jgi:hypothetical protein
MEIRLRNKRNRILQLRSYYFSLFHMITNDEVRLREPVLHLASSFCQDAVVGASAEPVLLLRGEKTDILGTCTQLKYESFMSFPILLIF